MAGLTPLPTHHIHSTTRLTHREAHTFLSSFLERADVDAAYRPDSTLTERGPQAVSTGSNPNLTLHHLGRILAGIEGKRVGGDLAGAFAGDDDGAAHPQKRSRVVDEDDDDDDGTPSSKNARRKIYEDGVGGHANGGRRAVAASDNEDWQDKDSFVLAEIEENHDLMAEERHPGAELEQPATAQEEKELVEVGIEETGEVVDPREQRDTQHAKGGSGGGALKSNDKEERKRLKKLRSKNTKATVTKSKD